jgi:hypothetical protein
LTFQKNAKPPGPFHGQARQNFRSGPEPKPLMLAGHVFARPALLDLKAMRVEGAPPSRYWTRQ